MGVSVLNSSPADVPRGDAPLSEAGRGAQSAAAFAAVAAHVSDDGSLDDLLAEVIRQACALLRVGRGSVFLPVSGQERFEGCVAVPHDDYVRRMVCGIEADGFSREILSTRRPVVIENAPDDTRPVRAAMRRCGVRSIIGFPIVSGDTVIALLFLDEPGSRSAFAAPAVTAVHALCALVGPFVAQARAAAAAKVDADALRREVIRLRRSRALDDQLVSCAIGVGGARDVVAALAELTRMPCLVYDEHHRRTAEIIPDGNVAPGMTILDPELCTRPEAAAALAKVVPGRPALIGALPGIGIHRRILVAPVGIDGPALAYIVLVEEGRRLGALHLDLARRAASLVAMRLEADSRTAAVQTHARAALVRELLGAPAEPATLRECGALHGIALGDSYAVAVIESFCDGGELPTLAELAAVFKEAGDPGRPMFTAEATRVTILLTLPDGPPLLAMRRLRSGLERVMPGLNGSWDLVAALSSACRLPEGGPAAFAEAVDLARWLREVEDRAAAPTVRSVDDLGAARLFWAAGDGDRSDVARRFAEHVLGPLLDGERGRDELLHTLHAFYEASRSVRRAGEALGVHENTVRYRLGRITELTGLDLAASADDQLAGQLAMLVLRLEDALAAPWSLTVVGGAERRELVAKVA